MTGTEEVKWKNLCMCAYVCDDNGLLDLHFRNGDNFKPSCCVDKDHVYSSAQHKC